MSDEPDWRQQQENEEQQQWEEQETDMKHSDQIDQIATALSKAQGSLEGAKKDSANPFFKSKYADLASVWDAFRIPFSENGLAMVQSAHSDRDSVTVSSMLVHTSGQWIKDSLTLFPKDSTPQAMGSAITYGRRYLAQSLSGVCPEDDDGNTASGRKKEPHKEPDNEPDEKASTVSQPADMCITPDQAIVIDDLITETGTDKSKFLDYYKVKFVANINASQYAHALAALQKKKAAQ